jgi:hypothetical protein
MLLPRSDSVVRVDSQLLAGGPVEDSLIVFNGCFGRDPAPKRLSPRCERYYAEWW